MPKNYGIGVEIRWSHKFISCFKNKKSIVFTVGEMSKTIIFVKYLWFVRQILNSYSYSQRQGSYYYVDTKGLANISHICHRLELEFESAVVHILTVKLGVNHLIFSMPRAFSSTLYYIISFFCISTASFSANKSSGHKKRRCALRKFDLAA